MDLSDFQRKAILLIFISILTGSILLARKEPFKAQSRKTEVKEYIAKPQGQTTDKKTQAPSEPIKIDINTANVAELEQLPGIGPSLANEIINYRTKNGPFSCLKDLLNVPGIGEGRVKRIKDYINLPEKLNTQGTRNQPVHISNNDTPKNLTHMDPSKKTDLNKATLEQLNKIPGINQKLAQAILDYRNKNGRFNNMEDLMNIPRIGKKTYEKLAEYLYINNSQETASLTTGCIYDSRTDPNVTCPFCNKQLWEKGKKKTAYIRCPHCLELLS